jgi:LPS sulfotransferase NodH
MNSTGLMGDPLEYLQPAHLDRWMDILKTRDLLTTFDELYKKRTSENGVFGLKAHYNQLKQIGGVDCIVDGLDVKKIIFVTRLNKIAQAISYSVARQTGAWISEDLPLRAAVYDYQSIKQCLVGVLEQEHAWCSYFRRCKVDVMNVSYESLCATPSAVLKDLSVYLGVEQSGVPIETRAQTGKQRGGQSVEWGQRFMSEFSKEQKLSFFALLLRRFRRFTNLHTGYKNKCL